ncbi:MAG: alpha-glucosidase/alpha-galactosidase [Candidatus Hadarchaeales archaeon]
MKICIVGAGSAAFSMKLIKDLCLTEGLEGSTVTLMDINAERLEVVHTLARRYAGLLGKEFRFERTQDRRQAIEGSDFVINVALQGGHEQQEEVRAIGEKHGYYRGIDSQEWNMVSDYPTFTSLGQLQLALDIARDVKELAPDAWFLQSSNPLLEISTLIWRELPGLKLVGLCDGPPAYVELVHVLGLDARKVEYQMAGLNHCVWLARFEHEGEDAYPLVERWIEEKAEEFWKTYAPRDTEPQLSRGAVDMYRTYKLFPIGCTTRNGTWKYHLNLEVKKYWFGPYGGMDSELSWPFYLERLERELKKLSALARDPNSPLLEEIPLVESIEPHIKLIDSLLNDHRRKIVVNLPNPGTFPGDAVVEVSAWVDGRGIHPERVHLPPETLSAVRARLRLMERSLQFFKTRDLGILLEVLAEDPRTKSERQARAVVEEIFGQPYLRDFVR